MKKAKNSRSHADVRIMPTVHPQDYFFLKLITGINKSKDSKNDDVPNRDGMLKALLKKTTIITKCNHEFFGIFDLCNSNPIHIRSTQCSLVHQNYYYNMLQDNTPRNGPVISLVITMEDKRVYNT